MASRLTTNDLQALLQFPFKQPNGTQKMVVGAALVLLSFVVPIVPSLFVAGYQKAVARRAIETGELVLPEWTGWSTLLKDGLKVAGAALIYLLPALMAFGLGYGGMMGTSLGASLVAEGGSDEITALMPLLLVGTFGGIALFGVGMILAVAAGAVLPVAITHMIATDDFAAAFRFHEWGAILRANLGAFALGYVLILGLSFVLSFAIQILQLTLVLCCLVPLVLGAYSMYMGTISSGLFGLIYREAAARRQAGEVPVPPAPPAPALG